jgi:uncharacterized YigZ family protein
MADSYLTLQKPSSGLFRDRNSRFLAFAYPVQSLDEVNSLLTSIRKKYHDARHHCFAYRINPENEQYRMNDDGEPSGTAGKPIYNQIVSNELFNVLIVVVRYFGGTLLGTGGLINAYKSASMDAIKKASIIEKYPENRYFLKFSYEKLSAVLRILKEEDLVADDYQYDIECTLSVSIPKRISGEVVSKLGTAGLVQINLLQSD